MTDDLPTTDTTLESGSLEAASLRRLHAAVEMQARVCALLRVMKLSEPNLMERAQPEGNWSLDSHAVAIMQQTESILHQLVLELRGLPVTLPPKVEALLEQWDRTAKSTIKED